MGKMIDFPEFVISGHDSQIGTVLNSNNSEGSFRVEWWNGSTTTEWLDGRGEAWRPCLDRGRAEKALEVVKAYVDEKYGTGWEPKLYEPGHEGSYWNISLEGADEWAIRIGAYDETEFPSGVYVEAVYSWCLALYPDPDMECGGHYDDDATLTSGVGTGEPTYCDGSCNP